MLLLDSLIQVISYWSRKEKRRNQLIKLSNRNVVQHGKENSETVDIYFMNKLYQSRSEVAPAKHYAVLAEYYCLLEQKKTSCCELEAAFIRHCALIIAHGPQRLLLNVYWVK